MLERKIIQATAEYRDGPWGRATKSSEGAAALNKPASLVFLALLERNGVEGAGLFRLSSPRTNYIFSSDDVHFVAVIERESFDVAARRFEPDGPPIWRRGLILVRLFWNEVEEVALDGGDSPHSGAEGAGVPENWRELAEGEPPRDWSA